MTARQQWTIVLGIVALLAVLLAAATHFLGDELFPVSVGSAAPPIEATTLEGAPRAKTLRDYEGKVVLLNVWATWCDPCREEMPSLERLYRDYRSRGLRIAAISIDDAGNVQLVRDFVTENRLTFDILHDPKTTIMRQYQVRGVPETFLISRRGEIFATRFAADWSSPAYRALVDTLLQR